MTGWCVTQAAIAEALHAAGQPTAPTLTADEPRKRVGNEETGKTAAEATTPFTDKSKVELLQKASQRLEKKRARSSRGTIRSFAGLAPGFLLKSPGDSKQGNKRRFHTREDARPRGSDAPAEPELGKRLRKQLEEWLPGVGGKVGGKEWCRQAKDVDMTDEEFCIMALLACKPAKRASEELEDQRRGQIGVHLRRRTTEDQPALSV